MKKLGKFMVICFAILAFASCVPNEPTVTQKIVGTWYASLKNSNVCSSNEMEVTRFNSDGTGLWCHFENDAWVESAFTYVSNNGSVTMTLSDGTTREVSIASIGSFTMLCKDVQNDVTWNLLKVRNDYTMQLLGSWKRTTEPLNEPNTINDVYTFNADGTYSVQRAAGATENGNWKAYGCVLYLSGEAYQTRTTTSITGYSSDMAWQTVSADSNPSACALQRVN